MLRNIKKILFVLLVFCLAMAAIINGSEGLSSRNIEKIAMVQSVGLDGTKSASITYTVNEITGDETANKVNSLTSTGNSYSSADVNAQNLSDKLLSQSYVKHYVIGLPTAKENLTPAVEYLCSSQVLQLSSKIYFCPSTSKDFLSELVNKSVSVDELLTNIRNAGEQDGYYYPITLLELMRNINDESTCGVPIMKTKSGEGSKGDSASAVFQGYGIVEKGKVICELNKSESRGYNFMRNKLKRTVVECTDAVLEVNKSRCSIKFVGTAEKIEKAIISVNVNSDIKEFNGKNGNDENEINKICMQEENVIREEINSMLKKSKEFNTDIALLSKALDIAYNGKISNSKELALSIPSEIIVNCKIDKSYNLKKA